MQDSNPKTRFDGADLRGMFSVATQLFARNVGTIDALNVFPVPDGDTGTNMFLTLRDVIGGAQGIQSSLAGEVASSMARGALMGARGNSGVILSQFFKGMALELREKPDFGAPEFALAFEAAREHAYKAVGNPVEGTLLTVISSVAETARESSDTGAPLLEVLDAVCQSAREAVALTPTLLPVLREAGVVDAGGYGMSVMLEGVRLYVLGQSPESLDMAPPTPVGVELRKGVVSAQFLTATDEELYGYCTQFLVEGEDLDLGAVRQEMGSLARSVVVVGDEAMIKVHVHAEDPGPIISYGVSLGTISQVKVESMDEQHREYSVARRQDVATGPARPAAEIDVVAVALGAGLERVFTELGASQVLTGGDTMNPSIREILDAVEAAPAENVILLPNNSNIVPAAKQAAELSRKQLRVVATTTIPQGVAAMLAFNPESALDANVSGMEGALSSIRSGEVCRAVRAVQLNGVSVREGQFIGLLEHKLAVAGDQPIEVLVSLLREADVSEGDLVTLYYGQGLTEQNADMAQQEAMAAFPGIETEIVDGGQPHYEIIVSIE